MIQLTFLPVLIPLGAAIILLALRHIKAQRGVALAATLITYALSFWLLLSVWDRGVMVYKQGDWPPPFGITLVADLLSAGMVVIAMTIAVVALVYSFASIDPDRERFFFYPLYQFQLMGVNGSFLTGDIFNLFVFFEVMLAASYALVALGGEVRQLEATVKYAAINLIGTTLLVSAVGLIYGLMGTLNMADLSQRVAQSPNSGLVTPIAMMFLLAFGLKAALFALWFWMPGTYTVVPAGLSAYFGGILTKVGVYSLLRVFTLIFNHDPTFTHTIILVMAGLTMFFGVLGAAAQKEFRTILTYHISSQVGYMVMGIGIFTPAAVAGTVFYIIHHIIVKSSLFLSGGIAERLTRSQNIDKMGGLLHLYPAVAFLFIIPALSLAGFPPLSGFWGKFLLIRAGIEAGGFLNYLVVAIALVVSLLTLYSMMKIWQGAYWGTPRGEEGVTPGRLWGMVLPTAFLVLLTLSIGFYPMPLARFSMATAGQLLDPRVYIEAVLGVSR